MADKCSFGFAMIHCSHGSVVIFVPPKWEHNYPSAHAVRQMWEHKPERTITPSLRATVCSLHRVCPHTSHSILRLLARGSVLSNYMIIQNKMGNIINKSLLWTGDLSRLDPASHPMMLEKWKIKSKNPTSRHNKLENIQVQKMHFSSRKQGKRRPNKKKAISS